MIRIELDGTLHSISATKDGGAIKNLIAKALVERIVRAAKEGQKFKVSDPGVSNVAVRIEPMTIGHCRYS